MNLSNKINTGKYSHIGSIPAGLAIGMALRIIGCLLYTVHNKRKINFNFLPTLVTVGKYTI
jgi:hypothetical protein